MDWKNKISSAAFLDITIKKEGETSEKDKQSDCDMYVHGMVISGVYSAR